MKKYMLSLGLFVMAGCGVTVNSMADKAIDQAYETPIIKAVSTMIEMTGSDERPVFAVMLHKYYIEGVPYRAFAFTVSGSHTPYIKQTENGFITTGVFKESMVHKKAVEGKETTNGLVKVSLEVRYEDIWGISGKTANGEKIDLYNPKTSKMIIQQ